MLKDVAKSVMLAMVGTGTFFFFLMMAVIPVMGMLARRGTTFTQSAVVDPDHMLRVIGLPAAAVLFVVFFVLAMRRMRAQGAVGPQDAAPLKS